MPNIIKIDLDYFFNSWSSAYSVASIQAVPTIIFGEIEVLGIRALTISILLSQMRLHLRLEK
jgi:hypothetical protein